MALLRSLLRSLSAISVSDIETLPGARPVAVESGKPGNVGK